MSELTLTKGFKLLGKRQFKELHTLSIQAVQRNPKNAVAFFWLGTIALEHKNFAKAIELFTKAESLDPSQAIYPAYHAKTLSLLRRPLAAKQSADRASVLNVEDDHTYDLLGVVYSRTGFHELAVPMFEQAVSRNQNAANYFYNLGASAQFLGDFEKAKTAYERCIKLAPDNYRAWASMVSLKKQTPQGNALKTLKALFETSKGSNTVDEDAIQQLGHAIAKTLEDLGEHEESYDWLVKAKANKRETYRYNKAEGTISFEAAKRTSLNLKKNSYSPECTPIFIVGLPRTGTTLVDRILSSHSEVISAGELNLFAELIKAKTNTPSNKVLDSDTFTAALNIDLAQIGCDYIQNTRDRARGKAFMIDKMPLNFFYAGLIHQALPNARIIALRRGAIDSCLSNFRQLLSVQESFYNYTFDIEDTAWFYRQFHDLMAHWRASLPADRFIEVQYEDIVFDQENQTRRLLDHCGLAWEEACLRFHENAAPVSTASSVQVRQPLYSGSIGRWKKYGDKLDKLKSALGDLAS